MPEISGGEIYDRLKAIDSNVKVLLSSGYSIDGQATEILNRGCDGFIQNGCLVWNRGNRLLQYHRSVFFHQMRPC